MENPLDQLIRRMSRLPGLGPRSARRAVLHLLRNRDALMLPLASELDQVARESGLVLIAVISTPVIPAGFAVMGPVTEAGSAWWKISLISGLWNGQRSIAGYTMFLAG